MVLRTMSTQTQRRAPWFAPFVLLVAGGGVAFAYAASSRSGWPDDIRSPLVAGSCLLSAIVILLRCRHKGAWRSAPSLGLGIAAIGVVSAGLLVTDATGPEPPRLGLYDVGFLAAGVLFLIAVAIEFREHVAREDRREIVADVALLTAAIGTMLFLSLRPDSAADAARAAPSAEFALIIASGASAYGALALARPNIAHLGMFLAVCGMCVGVHGFAKLWLSGSFEIGRPQVDLPIALSALFVAALVSVIPRRVTERRKNPARYGRAVLTTLSVAATSAALALVAVDRRSSMLSDTQASLLIGVLAAAVALRILVNQVRGTQSQRAVHDALDQKEAALRETDMALSRLQRANETLRESEERLRTVFESAVDGIVELDPRDVVVPAVARRRSAVERARRLDPDRRAVRLVAGDRAGDAPARGSRHLPRVEDLGDPRRPTPAAAPGPRRDGGPGGRPDDPLVVQIPAGPRRGPDADHAPDQRGDRRGAQPDRARPARRAGAGGLGRIAVARGGAPDAEGRRDRRWARHPVQGALRALGGGGQPPAADVRTPSAAPGGARPDPGAP